MLKEPHVGESSSSCLLMSGLKSFQEKEKRKQRHGHIYNEDGERSLPWVCSHCSPPRFLCLANVLLKCLDISVESIPQAEMDYITPCHADTVNNLKYKYNRSVFWNILSLEILITERTIYHAQADPPLSPCCACLCGYESGQCVFDLI